jgi:hypothetical protein
MRREIVFSFLVIFLLSIPISLGFDFSTLPFYQNISYENGAANYSTSVLVFPYKYLNAVYFRINTFAVGSSTTSGGIRFNRKELVNYRNFFYDNFSRTDNLNFCFAGLGGNSGYSYADYGNNSGWYVHIVQGSPNDVNYCSVIQGEKLNISTHSGGATNAIRNITYSKLKNYTYYPTYFSFKFQAPQNNDGNFIFNIQNTSDVSGASPVGRATRIVFSETSSQLYHGTSTNMITPFQANTDYFIELFVDWERRRYNITLNGTINSTDASFIFNDTDTSSPTFSSWINNPLFLVITGSDAVNKFSLFDNIRVGRLDNRSFNVTLDSSLLSDFNSCSCSTCMHSSSANLCSFLPLDFYSETNGKLEYSQFSFYSLLAIDNCTNTQGISTNGTALNITFYDQNGAVTNVNTTIQIESLANYSVAYKFKNNTPICVYPSWYNESSTLNIYYTSSGAQNVYSASTTLNNITQQITIISQQDATLQTILTYKDINTQVVIPNIYITVSRFVGVIWVVVASGYTDISGKFQVDYVANTRYKFTSSVTGYKDYSFELNPIISSTYDIKLSPSVAETNIPKFYRVTYDFNPKSFKNGLTNFNVTFTSAYGDLTYYGYTLIFPRGGVYYQSSDTGTTPTGSKLTSGNFVINATLPNDYVRIDLFYDTDISPLYNTTLYFTVSAPTVNNTFMNLKDNHYGMGILERTIIALLIVLFVVGLSTLAGQPVFGVALGLFVYGFFVYIGFLPIWSVIISFIIGFLIVAGREAGF